MAATPQKYPSRQANARLMLVASSLLILSLATAWLPGEGVLRAQAARQYSIHHPYSLQAGSGEGSAIDGRIWNDMDGSGAQEAGEGGIGSVAVWLDLNGDGLRDAGEPSVITDANGTYWLVGLDPGSYSLRVDAATLLDGVTQTGDPDGTLDNGTVVLLEENEQHTGANFGYRFTDALTISKTSSANGSVAPGDVITYTITVRNNTDMRQTGIAINDPLPARTTYVPGSSQVSGYVLSTFSYEYKDEFNSTLSYSGSNGTTHWENTPWQETGESDGPNVGGARIMSDPPFGNVLRPGENGSSAAQNRTVTRVANLAGCTTANFSFFYRRHYSLESDDFFFAEVSADGGATWPTEALKLTGGTTDSDYQPISHIITNPNEDTQVRFRSLYSDVGGSGAGTDRVYVDNVRIQCSGTILAPVTKSAGSPPALVTSSENFTLDPGQSMQVTYQATVNSPIIDVRASIDNTASVLSVQQPAPVYASTTDRLPLASLGDRVWHDTDNNGLQDPGEPGISGVSVSLYRDTDGDGQAEPGEADGAAIASLLTDAGGAYTFTDLPSGRYFLVFEQPAGYSAVPDNSGSDDSLDSDAGAGGASQVVALFPGAADPSLDAGLLSSMDYGDLPAAFTNTLLSEAGARHLLGGLRLGAAITADYDGRPDPNAGLDDGDDGVTRDPATPWLNEQEVGVFAVLSGGGDLGMWLDWNQDSDFNELGEFLAFAGLPAGQNRLTFTIPPAGTYTVGGAISARFRLFAAGEAPGGSLDAGDYVGYASDGEVEDYRWLFSPTAITLTSMRAVPAHNLVLPASVLALGVLLIVYTTWFGRKPCLSKPAGKG